MDLTNDADQTLVIIGNGMVSHRLCQRMVEYNAVDDKRIVVFGDEVRPAYDRVHLTDLLSGTPSTNLLLANQEWYAHNGIELFLDDPVVEVDRVNGIVRSKSGLSIAYTRLVFATGAQPFVPQVDVISPNGEELPGVFVYRTVDDIYDIEDRADELLGTPFMQAAVIGGGILGLEAAKAIYDLGLNVHVIEAAPWLMPRQLDAEGAGVLREKIERLDVKVHCGRNLKEVEALPFDIGAGSLTGIRLTFDKGDPLMVGMLVFAAGVRPRGELAMSAGLSTSENGGIIVDDRLQVIDKETGQPDEQIHAIGDCAVHRGTAYGLILPGYQMVDVLAANLVGGTRMFDKPDTSVRLKLMGVTVAAVGEYDADKRLGANTHVFNGGGLYRKLVVRNGRLIGAVTIGDWENLDRIRELLRSAMPLSFWDMRRFRGTGDLWAKSESPPVTEWAPEAVVCGCLQVTRGAIGEAILEGAANVEEVCARTKAGTLCGSCKPLISELMGLDVPASLVSSEAPVSQRGDAPVSRREGIRSRREVSRSRLDLPTIPRDPSAMTTQRQSSLPGSLDALSQNRRSTLLSTGSAPPPPLEEADEEQAPASVRTRVPRQTDAPKSESALGTPRTGTTTATELAAVLRTNAPAAEVKPSPRSLAVLAALHGDFSLGADEPYPRKDDTKLRKDDTRNSGVPPTPRTGTAVPASTADPRRDEAINSTRQLEEALPLIVSGAMPLAPDAAISSLTPAAGMVLGPALRAYAASAAKVAEMDSAPVKPPRAHTPTPPTGIELGSQLFGNKAVERSAAPTPPTGIPIVAPAPASQKKPPDTKISSGTPPTGMPVAERRPSTNNVLARLVAGEGPSRESSSGTSTSNVTVVESSPPPPRSKRAAPSVRVVAAEPLSTRTPASGMVLDKSQLAADAYSQLAIPRSARTGFEPNAEPSAKRPATERKTPTSARGDVAPPSTTMRARALQNRGASSLTSRRAFAADTGAPPGTSASERAPQSVRRPGLVSDSVAGGDESTPGTSEFPTEQSRSRSRISLIGAVEDREIVEVLGRESLIPTGDRAPVSRRTWVPPKNLSNAPGTLNTTSTPPPRTTGLPSALPPERGRKALLVASIVAVSWALVLVFAPPIPPARSVRASAIVDALTRNDVWKQVSGYLLVAVCLLSLGITLRKRWKRFQFSDVAFFRALHGIVTAGSLVLFFAHTGFRVGHGLNFVLTVSFLAAMLIGAVAGAVFALSDRWSALAARDRRLRASWIHVLVLWPLPILVALHVLMVYYY